MKHLKLWIVCVLSVVFGASFALAQGSNSNSGTARSPNASTGPVPPGAPGKTDTSALPRGQVQAFIVNGDVKIMGEDGKQTALTKGQIFSEHNTVIAGPNGMALLVFSNGATMRVQPNAQLEVSRFRQAPFDDKAEGGSFLRLTRDPSQSDTQLYLNNGTLQGEVKTLNQAAGSTFTVNTPAGSAGIRGTVVSITVIRDATGRVTSVIANCVVGNMGFTPKTGAPATSDTNGTQVYNNQNLSNTDAGTADVPAGAQFQITLDVNALGQISGFSAAGAGIATQDSTALLTDVYSVVNTARTEAGIPVAPPPAAPPPTLPTSTTLVVTPTGQQPITITATPVPAPLAPQPVNQAPPSITGTISQPPAPNTNTSTKGSTE